ncbi:MAG: TIGR02099 family protein [Sulfuricella denitrificans]|nr:TIGR02099 family protein [Sulfuricella denitrificans]
MLKTTARWLHRFLVTVLILAGLVFAGIVLGLRYWLLPNIADYRENIASSISQSAGQRVTIGEIEAGWDGLRPQLNMHGVDVFDAAGNPALHLAHIEGTLAWWNLALGEIRLHSLEIDHPNLALRRTAKGEIYVGGVWVNQPGSESGFADWLLRQHRIIVRGATLTWQDELRQAPLLALNQLNLRLENRGHRHRFGLRAVPPPALALPLDIRGDLKGDGLGDFSGWSGMLYSRLDYTNVSLWRNWVDLPFQIEHGSGGVRLWLGLDGKILKSLTLDLQLKDVLGRLSPDLQQLDMAQAAGRLSLSDLAPGRFLQASNFSFRLRDGAALGPVSASLKVYPARNKSPARGELKIDSLDLAPLLALSDYLPVDDEMRSGLQQLQPKGSLREFSAGWSGSWPELQHYEVRSKFINLSIRPYALASGRQAPAFANLSGNVDFNEKIGALNLKSRQLSLLFPGVFDHALDLDVLTAQLSWSKKGEQHEFKLANASVNNNHLAGTAFGTYRTSSDGPGQINLSAQFNRADARFVSHYMPLVVGQETHDWLARSLKGGHASDVQLKLKGDLAKFPFEDGKSGLFQVTVKASGGRLEYAPGWPEIDGIGVDLLFRGKHMDIFAHSGHTYGMQISKVHVQIPDLLVKEEMLLVEGEAQGPTQDMLKFIDQSPVSAMIDDFSQGMQAAGNGKFKLNLKIPLRHLDDITVGGGYLFQNNKVMLGEGFPALDQVNGVLQFTGSSVVIPGLSTQFLGGPASIKASTQQGVIQINANGRATAAGLGKAFQHPLMQRIQGSTSWNGSISLRKKLANAVFTSNLKGLGSSLPLPLNKAEGDSVLLRIERKATVLDQDVISIRYGNILSAQLERRQQSGQMKVQRGAIRLGGGPAELPSNGIWLNGALPYVDFDHWREVSNGKGGNGEGFAIDGANLKLASLDVFGKRFKDMGINAWRLDGGWQAVLESQEMSGSVNWKPGGAGRVNGRFKSLSIPPAAPSKLSEPAPSAESTEYPSLDIIAENFSIRNNALGRLELVAAPNGRDWRIEKLKLNTPETSLSLDGVWQDWLQQPRSQFNLLLETSDIGKLLARVGHPDSVRGGKAELKGRLSWNGSPAEIHYSSLSGNMSLEAHKGQFLKIEPGIGKLLGILSLQALPRRITLDFRDVFSEGFAFDDISMNVKASQGVVSSNDFKMDGPAAKVSMQGETSLARETQNFRVRVVPVLGDTVSSAAAFLAGPVVGLTTLLVQKVLKDPIGQIIAYEYSITGTWDNPVVTKLKRGGGENKSPDSGG